MKFIRFGLIGNLMVILVWVFLFGSSIKKVIAVSLTPLSIAEYINNQRMENKVPPLALNTELSKAAYQKGLDMLEKDYWDHYGPNGETPWQFILKSGYDYTYAGENLAKGFSDAYDVVLAWMASPSHRENILDKDFSDIGIAVLYGKLQGQQVYLIVSMFGTTAEEAALRHYKNIPTLVFVRPESGDILASGEVDVRLKAKNLKNNEINLFVDDVLVKTIASKSPDFSDSVALPAGKFRLSSRALGAYNEPLLDFVDIVVKDYKEKQSELKEVRDAFNLEWEGENLRIDLSKQIPGVSRAYIGLDGVGIEIRKFPAFIPESRLNGLKQLKITLKLKDRTTIEFYKDIPSKESKKDALQGVLGLSLVNSDNSMVFIVASFGIFLFSILGLFLSIFRHTHILVWDVFIVDLIYLIVLQLINAGFVQV